MRKISVLQPRNTLVILGHGSIRTRPERTNAARGARLCEAFMQPVWLRQAATLLLTIGGYVVRRRIPLGKNC
jgi:hypothetical protein